MTSSVLPLGPSLRQSFIKVNGNMRLHLVYYFLLLAGLDSLFVEPDSGAALLVSLDAENPSQGTSRGAYNPGVPALAEMLPNGASAPNSGAEIRPELATKASSKGGSADAKNSIIHGHLHIDLSLRTNVELVARLAPLILRLTAEQKALSSPVSAPGASPTGSPTARVTSSSLLPSADVLEGTSDTSAESADTGNSTSSRAFSPEIQLELSYHIFDMEENATSAPHCITGELGRFCAFPPDMLPTEAEGSEQHVGGRVVVEEALLQLCLAKFAEQDFLTETTMTGTQVSGERMGDEDDGLARRKDVVADHSREAPLAQLNNTSVSSYSDLPGQRLRVLWKYVDAWCCNCNTLDRSCDRKTATAAVGEEHKTKALQDDRAAKTGVEGIFSPFEAACSRAQLAKLEIRDNDFMKNCEKAAGGVLQQQVDNRLAVVPSLLIDGKPALGELTAASVMKTLCSVAEERAAAAAPPGTPPLQLPAVCRAPDIMSSPVLVVKSLGVGVNSELINSLKTGVAGDLEVAAHLLNTYGQSSEGPTTQAALSAAPTRPGMDLDGRYHFVNPKALRFLRKRMLARTSRRRRKITPIVSADAGSTASSDESSEAAVLPAPAEILMKSAAVEAESAANVGGQAITDRDYSASPMDKSAVSERVDAVSEQVVTKNAAPLTLEGPRSGSSSVPLSGKTFHVEGEHDQRPVFDSLAPQQKRTAEVVVEISASASKQCTDTTKHAGVLPCGEKTKSAACVTCSSAAGATFDGADAFITRWSLHLFLYIAVLLTVVAWFFMCRKRTAIPSSLRQHGESGAHQTALLVQTSPNSP